MYAYVHAYIPFLTQMYVCIYIYENKYRFMPSSKDYAKYYARRMILRSVLTLVGSNKIVKNYIIRQRQEI